MSKSNQMNEGNLTDTQDQSRLIIGKVISDKNDKTIVVAVERKVAHPKYGKYIKRVTKLHVHDPENQARIGYVVSIKQSRPISKMKKWQLVEIIERDQQ